MTKFSLEKSGASFCHQVAAWSPDVSCNFSFNEKSQNHQHRYKKHSFWIYRDHIHSPSFILNVRMGPI